MLFSAPLLPLPWGPGGAVQPGAVGCGMRWEAPAQENSHGRLMNSGTSARVG